jgi:hypothetical protein
MAATLTRVKSLKPIRGIKEAIVDLDPGPGYVALDGIDLGLDVLKPIVGFSAQILLVTGVSWGNAAVGAFWDAANGKLFLTDNAGGLLGDGDYTGDFIRLWLVGS